MSDDLLTLGMIRAAGSYGCSSWMDLLEALGEDPAAVNLDRTLSIGDIVLACGVTDALFWLHLVPPRARVAGVMRSVRRALKHTSDQRTHYLAGRIHAWLAGADVDLEAEVRGADRNDRAAALDRAWIARASAGRSMEAVAAWTATRAECWAAEAVELAAKSVYSHGRAAALAAEAARMAVRMARAADRIERVAAAMVEETVDGEWTAQRADLLELYPPVALAGRNS